MEMNKEKFRLVFELAEQQPWILGKYDVLENLLWNECDDERKRELLIELLHRFVHVTASNFTNHLQSLAKKIANDPALSDESTQLVAMAADSSSDSSQYLLYALKPIMERLGWRRHKLVNRFGLSYREYKKNNKLKNIVLIDEFIGSGQTVLGRVKTIKSAYESAGVEDINIIVKVIASTKQGMDVLLGESIHLDAEVILRKGISDFYDSDVVKDKLSVMESLENTLLEEYEDIEMPRLGYGETECLYVRDDGNTPNSVFPIFWWPFFKSGDERRTLLTRAMGDA